MSIRIPQKLAGNHGKENAAMIGARWAETFEHLGALSADSAVLDIGCGPGRMAIGIGERFAFKNPAYLGFDIIRRDIDFCTREITGKYPQFKFAHLDVFNGHYNPKGSMRPETVRFPTRGGAYDFAFATSVFTHMRTPELQTYLRETGRSLRGGGKFLATFFCIEDGIEAPEPPRFDFATQVDSNSYTATPTNPEDVIGYRLDFVLESFTRAGYTDVTFHRGGWPGLQGCKHSQDIVVATKPKRLFGFW